MSKTRKNFKKIIESIVTLPLVLPYLLVGIEITDETPRNKRGQYKNYKIKTLKCQLIPKGAKRAISVYEGEKLVEVIYV